MTNLRAIREYVSPLLHALDQEVVQPGLATAMETMRTVSALLDCPIKEAWVLGAHRHAALQGALARFAFRQQGWTASDRGGVPYYSIGFGLFLTVKRTPQGRSASKKSCLLSTDDFELEGHQQQSFLDNSFYPDSPLMHIVALDYVCCNGTHCLTALLKRHGRKQFDSLVSIEPEIVVPRLVLPSVVSAGPSRPRIKLLKGNKKTAADQ